MRISIEGPQIGDFNFERAADIWGGMRNRRLSVGDYSYLVILNLMNISISEVSSSLFYHYCVILMCF